MPTRRPGGSSRSITGACISAEVATGTPRGGGELLLKQRQEPAVGDDAVRAQSDQLAPAGDERIEQALGALPDHALRAGAGTTL